MSSNRDLLLSELVAAANTPEAKVDALFEFMLAHGDSFYDESVTQLEHAVQAAHLARRSQAPLEQVVGALLHDIGHFWLDEHNGQSDFLKKDWCHEDVGARCLEQLFGKEVTEPIRLHVPAKRYICTVDAAYFDGLSNASKRSLEIQGGLMTPTEVAEFEANPFCEIAVRIRRWDDGAKVRGWVVPGLGEYRREVERCLKANCDRDGEN
jgi:predicted HD phosphohydrolase